MVAVARQRPSLPPGGSWQNSALRNRILTDEECGKSDGRYTIRLSGMYLTHGRGGYYPPAPFCHAKWCKVKIETIFTGRPQGSPLREGGIPFSRSLDLPHRRVSPEFLFRLQCRPYRSSLNPPSPRGKGLLFPPAVQSAQKTGPCCWQGPGWVLFTCPGIPWSLPRCGQRRDRRPSAPRQRGRRSRTGR